MYVTPSGSGFFGGLSAMVGSLSGLTSALRHPTCELSLERTTTAPDTGNVSGLMVAERLAPVRGVLRW